MSRIILMSAMFALCVSAVALPASSAMAENKKGFMSFFNRDNGSGSAPVHMEPNIAGSSNSTGAAPVSLGKSPAKMARYEDSPIHADRARAQQNFDNWNANQLAAANASTEARMAQFRAQSQQAEQMARAQQAQAIAQQEKNRKAGIVPARATGSQPQQSMAPAAATAAPAVAAPEEQKPEEVAPKPKREHKPRHFFNRITE